MREVEPENVAEAIAAAGMVNYCPCGCTLEDLDEHGYCDHLVGFTNDKKKYEALIRERDLEDKELTGRVKVVSGNKGAKRKPIEEGDILVNPTFEILDNGAWHTAHRWVSYRVYRAKKENKLAKAS